jgi:lysophospholipase L1-like esterase
MLLTLAGCAGGSPTQPSGATTPPPPSPPPPPVETFSVDVLAFYDENGNLALDSGERVRIPEAEIEIGGKIGLTALGGGARVDGVPAGEYPVVVLDASLPPYFRAGAEPTITVPTSEVVEIPITLPIGSNTPNRYIAFGDSITEGGPRNGNSAYRSALRDLLQDFFGAARVVNSGVGGTTSNQGNDRFLSELVREHPAVALIVYGTNDWNACTTPDECFTVRALREMVRTARGNAVMPFVATILPTNTGFNDRAPPWRNTWVEEMNARIREMVEEEGAVLMDIHSAFVAAADGGDYSRLFEDHVHPTPLGYDIMAHKMADAITRRVGGDVRLVVTASRAGSIRDGRSLLRRPLVGYPNGLDFR